MSTQIAVIEQPKVDMGVIAALKQELERLQFELECDTERADRHFSKLKEETAQLNARYLDRLEKLHALYTGIGEDDLENESYKQELEDVLTDHGYENLDGSKKSEEQLDEEAATEVSNLIRELKTTYKQICLRLHPDKTGGIVSDLFLRAKTAYEETDIEQLRIILAQVTGEYSGTIEQSFEEAIADVLDKATELRSTVMWELYELYLNQGYGVSLTQYKSNLLATIAILEEKINKQSEI